ncbi:aminotransferase DegT, partial [Candidatus Bathyarchaeota archaeon]|nr:aminotransferase DegT [Candidatus Bathyarchaeota archaeon]
KTLTTGEGGIVTTNDPELYRLGCLIRSHGDESRYNHVIMGLNYRITDIMSVIGLNQLAKMNEFITKRRENAEAIIQGLKKVESVHPQKITEKTNPSYSYFSVVIDTDKLRCNRDEFMKALIAENIDCAAHYPTPLTRQPIIQKLMKPCKCPISEDVSQRILSLPVHPYLSKDDLNNIVEAVKKVEVYYSKY